MTSWKRSWAIWRSRPFCAAEHCWSPLLGDRCSKFCSLLYLIEIQGTAAIQFRDDTCWRGMEGNRVFPSGGWCPPPLPLSKFRVTAVEADLGFRRNQLTDRPAWDLISFDRFCKCSRRRRSPCELQWARALYRWARSELSICRVSELALQSPPPRRLVIIPIASQKFGGRPQSSVSICCCWRKNSGSAGILLGSRGYLCGWTKSMRAQRKSSVESPAAGSKSSTYILGSPPRAASSSWSLLSRKSRWWSKSIIRYGTQRSLSTSSRVPCLILRWNCWPL